MLARFYALKRLLNRRPRLVLLLVFVVSCVYALFACPDGMALSVGYSDGVYFADNYIPVLAYMVVGGGFMAAFCTGTPRNTKAWGCAAFLLLFHFYFMRGTLMAL